MRKGVYKEGKREQYTASVLRSTEKKLAVLDRLGEGKREQYTASVLRSTEKKLAVLDRLGES